MFSLARFPSLLFAATLVLSTASAAEPIRVMSFNIRYGTAKDGDNVWGNRKDFVADTIKAFNPDLLGTQETLAFQRDNLVERLPGYATFGVGRTDGKEDGEMMSIFYRTNRFEKLDGGHFWLSETPDVVGSKSWDSSLPRMASWLKLRDKKNNETLWYINTHFDHRGPEARLQSAKLVRRKVAELSNAQHTIVTGDFNAAADSDPYKALFGKAGQGNPLIDTYRAKHSNSADPEGTFTGFNIKTRSKARIDWIAVTPNWTIESAEIDLTNREGVTPSDHLPVTTVLRLE